MGRERGNTIAASNLACMYWSGKGVIQNSSEAIGYVIRSIELHTKEDEWILSVDESGDEEACFEGVVKRPELYDTAKQLLRLLLAGTNKNL